MVRLRAPAAAVAVVCGALCAPPLAGSVAAQHEHHDVRPDSAVRLNALTTSAERDAVVLRSGATIVDVRASASAGGSIADLLRTVPGVEIDADGRINMRGGTGVLLLMNGRRISLSGDALVAFLRQMPAAALERVEAGTAVSARHDADGAAGIVNLVFRDNAVPRTVVRSLAASMATDDHFMGSGAATGHIRDALTWDVMYSLTSMRPRTDAETSRWTEVPGDLPLHTDQDRRARETHRLHSVLAGAAVRPTRNSSLALRSTYSWMEGSYRSRSAFTYTNASADTDSSRTASWLEHVIPSGELSATAAVDLGALRLTSHARVGAVKEDVRGAWTDEHGGYEYMAGTMASRQRESAITNGLGVRSTALEVEVGHESRWRSIIAGHEGRHFDATVSRRFRQELDVHAGHLTARQTIAGARAEMGLRVEADHSDTQVDTRSTSLAVRVLPAISAEWFDGPRALRYRFAYSRRITRADAAMLNPYAMGADDTDSIVGNPSLTPELSDQVEVGIERHRQRLTLTATPFVRWSRDPIRQLKSATERGTATTTYRNLSRASAVGADGSIRVRAMESAVLMLMGSVAHMTTVGDSLRSSGVHATARLTLDVQLTGSTTAQLYAYRRSARAIEQGEILPMFTSDLALTRQLADDHARVTLRVSDPWRSDRQGYRVADAGFWQESRRRSARPLLSLFASWAVGGAPREDAPARREGPDRIF